VNIRYTSADGRMTLAIEGETQKDLFREIAEFQSVFELYQSCGCCHSTNIRFIVRTPDKYIYYSLRCSDCTAEFKFGQLTEGGGLYPKFKDDEDNILPNGGWSVYRGKGASAPSPAHRQAAAGPGNRASSPASRATTGHMGGGPPPHAPVDDEMPPF